MDRRRLLCSLLLAAALPPALAQGTGRRVLLVYLPDRPVAQWRGGLALRLCHSAVPTEDVTRVLQLPGFDWSRMLLDAYVSAFTQAYPQLGFVPAYNLAATLAPPDSWHLGALHVSDMRVREAIAAELRATGAQAVIVLDGSNPGDSGRTNPYGSVGLYTKALPAAGRFKATPRWFVTLRVLDPSLNQATATEGGSLDDAGLRSFEGTEPDLAALATDGNRRIELLAALRASLDEGARASMRNFAMATELARAGATPRFKQPFAPPGPG